MRLLKAIGIYLLYLLIGIIIALMYALGVYGLFCLVECLVVKTGLSEIDIVLIGFGVVCFLLISIVYITCIYEEIEE